MRTLGLAAACLLLSGCTTAAQDPFSDQAIRAAFPDATMRFTNITGQAEHETSYKIPVPESAYRLVIKAVYRTNGDSSFVLKVPAGNGAKFETFAGARSLQSDQWFATRDPDPGRWAFSAHLTHGGAYAFGVYLSS